MKQPATRHLAECLVLAVGLALAVLLAWPQAVGAHRLLGIAQLISFRPMLGIGLAVLGAAAVVLALVLPRGRRSLSLGLAVLLLAACAGQGVVLGVRGIGPPPETVGDDLDLPTGDLVVLSWNTHGGDASPRVVADLALSSGADVLALPETNAELAGEIAELLEGAGHPMIPHTTGDRVPTSVLISERLGPYRLDVGAGSTPRLPSGVWLPEKEGGGPPLVIAHPMRPSPDGMADWRGGLGWISAQCARLGPDVVLAGDLNATADHLGKIPGCRDAAASTGTAGRGTWPSSWPSFLGTPIDHVMAGAAWTPVTTRVLDTGADSSDHRPVLAVLRRA